MEVASSIANNVACAGTAELGIPRTNVRVLSIGVTLAIAISGVRAEFSAVLANTIILTATPRAFSQ